jgi:transposase
VTEGIRYIGLDVHAATISVAIAESGTSPARARGTITHSPGAVAKLVKRLGPVEQLRCCYEAGPTGFGLHRQLTRLGVDCIVVAPSLIPTKAGDTVKTDRRDAEKLARLLRSGELTGVWIPDEAAEALRDFSRLRESAKQDLHRVRQQLGKFLLRLSVQAPPGLPRWSRGYRTWLGQLALREPLEQAVLTVHLAHLDESMARLAELTGQVEALAQSHPQAALIQALTCQHGIGLVTALTVVAELGDLSRFASARALMGYAGLGPREHSSGGRVRRGGISKRGNSHLRRVVVEAAWHYRHAPGVGPALQRRRANQPAVVLAIADKGHARLHRRYRKLLGRGKLPQQVVVAVARELLGFIWAIARAVRELAAHPSTPTGAPVPSAAPPSPAAPSPASPSPASPSPAGASPAAPSPASPSPAGPTPAAPASSPSTVPSEQAA